MKKNVSTVDAIMRITFGLTGVAWGTARMVHHPHRGLPMLVTLVSAMKVAEGVTRFCPMLALFNTNSKKMVEDMAEMADMAKESPVVKQFTPQEEVQ